MFGTLELMGIIASSNGGIAKLANGEPLACKKRRPPETVGHLEPCCCDSSARDYVTPTPYGCA